MDKPYPMCLKRNTSVRIRAAVAILKVALYGAPYGRKLHAYLMLASGVQIDLQ